MKIDKNVLIAVVFVVVAVPVVGFIATYEPLQNLTRENKALRNSLEAKEAVIDRLQQQNNILSAMLQNITRENEDLQRQIEQLEAYQDLYLNATEEIQELNTTIEELNREIKALEDQLDYYRKLKTPELTSLQRMFAFTTYLLGEGNYTYLVTLRNATVLQITDYYWQNSSAEYLYLNITSQEITVEIKNFYGLQPIAFLYVQSGDYLYCHAEELEDGKGIITIRLKNVTMTDGTFVPHLDLKVRVEAQK